MPERKLTLQTPGDETAAFNRRFKYAVIGLAVVEFVVIVLVFIYKTRK